MSWWGWIAFVAFLLATVSLDLFAFRRKGGEVTLRDAGIWSAAWIALGLGFAGVVAAWLGGRAAGQYLAGYLIEKALSVDNVFVFAVILSPVPSASRHRVLLWGVLGALVLRAGFIVGGVALLDRFEWMPLVFGALLVVTGIRMSRRPLTGAKGREPRRQPGAVSLLGVLLALATTDVLFAADSIPAVLAVTRDPFLVFTSNAFAVLGLRALFFLLAGAMERFVNLHLGLAAILVFVGVKMAASEVVQVPVWVSLLVIAVLLAAALLASARWGRSPLGAVVRFVRRSGKRIAVTIGGFALLAAGAIMLVTPGPGLLVVVAGLALLATEYAWAERALSSARERARSAARRLRRRRTR